MTSSLPIWASSYEDPAVIKAAGKELVDVAKTQLDDMILRPQVVNYNADSASLQVEIQNALLGKKDPQTALDDAVGRLQVERVGDKALNTDQVPR